MWQVIRCVSCLGEIARSGERPVGGLAGVSGAGLVGMDLWQGAQWIGVTS